MACASPCSGSGFFGSLCPTGSSLIINPIFLILAQNIAEIEEIPWSEKDIEITLPAAERAIYLELEHHLRALDMTIKRGKKTESDREKRLAQSLGDSK